MRRSWESEHPQYTKYELGDEEVLKSPWTLWNVWQADARAVLEYTNEVALSTCGSVVVDGTCEHQQPTVRMVLLKYCDEALGFCWYSKGKSEKGVQLSEVPYGELLWYVHELQRQVRIRGTVSMTNSEEAASYARSRPRKSQISAYISQQSSEIKSRTVLERIYNGALETYKDKDIPVAKDWTGYVLSPVRFEFWQGRSDRLHDRIIYARIDNSIVGTDMWRITRLQP